MGLELCTMWIACTHNYKQKKGKKMGSETLDILKELAGPLIQAGTSIFQSERQNSIAENQYNQNLAFNRETRDTNWAREDNQLQRAKADAEAAGFSPLAALGNTATGATASAPGATTNGGHVADLSGLVGVVEQMYQRKHESDMQTEELNAQKEMQKEKLESEERIARLNRASSESIASADLNEKKRQFDADLAEKIRQYNDTSSYQNKILEFQAAAQTEEQEYKYAMMYQEWYKQNKQEGAPLGEECKTQDEYENKLLAWYGAAIAVMDTLGVDTSEAQELMQRNKSTAGLRAGANGDLLKQLSALMSGELGTEQEAEGKTSGGSNNAEYIKRRWNAYLQTHPQPIPPNPFKYTKHHDDYKTSNK